MKNVNKAFRKKDAMQPVSYTHLRENNWDLTSRVTVTAFGENSLSELESYEKVLELALPLERELPSDAELIPECWLRAEDLRLSLIHI